jgi:hypothetical protein
MLAGLVFSHLVDVPPLLQADEAKSEISATAKPWARWWWLGSAVTPAEIARQLALLDEAGFGGVEIQAIYAAKDSPLPALPFLSSEWTAMLRYTLEEARRRGMDVDLTLGSGWPFGGPWLDAEHAARRLVARSYPLSAADTPKTVEDTASEPIDFVLLVSPEVPDTPAVVLKKETTMGHAGWVIPKGDWIVYEIRQGFTRQQVKRAAPGSEGPVLDHFSQTAFADYIEPFSQMLEELGVVRPRANFNDSYEVFGANWTPDLLKAFQDWRGYDLLPYLPFLLQEEESELSVRVKRDYRETVFELYAEAFCQPWAAWSHEQGMRIRFQAHGAPGPLLDLYALADIPETEGFGRGGIDLYASKFASSAAHLYDKPLVSSETFTWLDEHFQVSLDRMRQSVDWFFLAGVNHVFYHGVPYSPEGVAFPGWQFYASVNAGEHASWFPHLPYFNAYIARIQSVLQQSQFDPDVLVYYPIYDFLSQGGGARDGLQFCRIHNTDAWLGEAVPGTRDVIHSLWEKGIQFDYGSDRALQERIQVTAGQLRAGKMTYRGLVIPAADWMDGASFEAICQAAEAGVAVVLVGEWPRPLPRNGDPLQNQTDLSEALQARLRALEAKGAIVRIASADGLVDALQAKGIAREPLVDQGFSFLRQTQGDQTLYYLKYDGDEVFQGWLPLRAEAKGGVLCNPIDGRSEPIAAREGEPSAIFVTVEPGETRLVTLEPDAVSAQAFREEAENMVTLSGPWTLTWTDTGESRNLTLAHLVSWTEIPELTYYSGAVSYETTFMLAQKPEGPFRLVLEGLHESAEVWVNGQRAGAVWTQPYTLWIEDGLREGENTLRLDVINLPANRIIQMDQAKVDWKKYYFVNIDYKPFDAADWSLLPSGILGPMRLEAVRRKAYQ